MRAAVVAVLRCVRRLVLRAELAMLTDDQVEAEVRRVLLAATGGGGCNGNGADGRHLSFPTTPPKVR